MGMGVAGEDGEKTWATTTREREKEGRTLCVWIMVAAVTAWAADSGVDDLMSGLVNTRVVVVRYGSMNVRTQTKRTV